MGDTLQIHYTVRQHAHFERGFSVFFSFFFVALVIVHKYRRRPSGLWFPVKAELHYTHGVLQQKRTCNIQMLKSLGVKAAVSVSALV